MRAQLAGVAKHFGAQEVLEDVMLIVGPRARIGLVGANGAGKTTLLRLLAGFDGTLVIVSHDRRFLERVTPTREIAL